MMTFAEHKVSLLQVRHSTIYRYRRAIALGAHRLMLRPRDDHDLRLVSTELRCSPSATITWSHDVSGNSVAHATFAYPSDELSITSDIVVEQYAPEWPVFAIDAFAHTFPFAYSSDEIADLGAMRVAHYADPADRLKTWARAFVLGDRTDTLSLLKDINSGVSSWISYRSRDKEGTQTPLETLGRGRGSCRDFAVLFCEAARTLGFGARIASGYLYDRHSTLTGTAAAGSTHAWVEVYLPGAGWIAFDPTNRALGSANLIRVAVARTIEQTSPISGSFAGAPDDLIGMEVTVSVVSV